MYNPTILELILAFTVFVFYFVAMFTVALFTFRKGYTFLGILGIFIPILWLIGAILPTRPGSEAWRDESARHQSK